MGRVFQFWICVSVVLVGIAGFAGDAQAQQSKTGKQTFGKLPPDGIEIETDVRKTLTQRVVNLKKQHAKAVSASQDAATWSPDVLVLIRAVDLALKQNLFFKKSETKVAGKLLDEAGRRLSAVAEGKRGLELLVSGPERVEAKLVVGGFVSKIDDSVQPYGLVLPANYKPRQTYRVDIWLHGRGNTKLEVAFLNERMTKPGQYTPDDTIVLHPFGRHCNAFKFAGETDVYESLAHVQSFIKTKQDRIAIRGFSMGGAGCWHLAAHDPTQWFAANPGAGFIDTIEYQRWTEKAPFELGDTRTKLMQLYDVMPWVANLQNTNLIAYSGEVDKQKKAADRVIDAGKQLGFQWSYVIGKDMGHKIDEASKEIIENQIGQWATAEVESPRESINFTTFTTRYGKADWLTITGLKEHWVRSNVVAKINASKTIEIKTDGVTHLKLDFSQSGWPSKQEVGLNIDGERFYVSDTSDKDGLQCNLVRGDQWEQIAGDDDAEIRKKPGLQGPIDDAFRERFLFVMPSRPAANGVVQRWLNREIAYSKDRWERLMRGNVRIVNDVDLTDEQIANNHLVCFGDFLSNRYLNKMAPRLPFKWTRDELVIGDNTFDAATHAAVFCYPNPKNPKKYIVVNSGMTFREFSNVSNSRQIAMLPDWAVLKVSDNFDDSIFAGEIKAEGFFSEYWQP